MRNPQAITFPALANKVYGDGDVTPAATAPGGVLLLQFHTLAAIVADGGWNALRHGHYAYYATPVLVRMLDEIGFEVTHAFLFDLYGGTVLLAARRHGVDGPRDPDAVTALVERLRVASPDFRRRWSEHEVAVRRADRKTLVHPRVGELVLDCETLVTPDQGQRMVVLTPADAETRDRLDLLRVVGLEEFAGGAGS